MTQKTPPQITRPLSPFMLGSTYRFQMTSLLSITHRISGVALVAGTLVLVCWLSAAAYSIHCFEAIRAFFNGFFGRLLLLGWTLAFYFHLLNGVRHLFWDIGKGFALPDAYRSGYLVLIGTALLTLITWMLVFSMGGTQ